MSGTRMRISLTPGPKHSVLVKAVKSVPAPALCPAALPVVKSTSHSTPRAAAPPKRFTTITAQPWPSTAKLLRLAMRIRGSSSPPAAFLTSAASAAGAFVGASAGASVGVISVRTGSTATGAISVTTSAPCSASRPPSPPSALSPSAASSPTATSVTASAIIVSQISAPAW